MIGYGIGLVITVKLDQNLLERGIFKMYLRSMAKKYNTELGNKLEELYARGRILIFPYLQNGWI